VGKSFWRQDEQKIDCSFMGICEYLRSAFGQLIRRKIALEEILGYWITAFKIGINKQL
jgi:hypothetical protein